VAPMFCPNCGKQLLLAGQKFCAYCAGDLGALAEGVPPASPSASAVSSTPASRTPPLALSPRPPATPAAFVPGSLAPWLSGPAGGAVRASPPKPTATNGPPLLQLGIAIAALCTFILPFASASESYSGTSLSLSVSLLDIIQKMNWTSYIEMLLIVFGGAAAAVAALLRLNNPRMSTAAVTLLGFIAMAAGYVWMLAEWNGELAQAASFYSYVGVNVGLQPSLGLWVGLAAAVVGGFVCLIDVVESGSMSASITLDGAASGRPVSCPHCGAVVPAGVGVCWSCNGHVGPG